MPLPANPRFHPPAPRPLSRRAPAPEARLSASRRGTKYPQLIWRRRAIAYTLPPDIDEHPVEEAVAPPEDVDALWGLFNAPANRAVPAHGPGGARCRPEHRGALRRRASGYPRRAAEAPPPVHRARAPRGQERPRLLRLRELRSTGGDGCGAVLVTHTGAAFDRRRRSARLPPAVDAVTRRDRRRDRDARRGTRPTPA